MKSWLNVDEPSDEGETGEDQGEGPQGEEKPGVDRETPLPGQIPSIAEPLARLSLGGLDLPRDVIRGRCPGGPREARVARSLQVVAAVQGVARQHRWAPGPE